MTLPQPTSRPRVALIGGGVHAAVVADCVRRAGEAELVGYTDRPEHDRSILAALGVAYLGEDDVLASLAKQETITAGHLAIGGVDNAVLRASLADRHSNHLPDWWTAIHPTATIASSARIEPGSVVFAQAVINPMARIGRHAIINTAGVIEHHCVLDDFAVVSPNATLCGRVKVGQGSFIGAAAVVISDVTIGTGSVVGAGSVVIRDVPDHVVVAGNPARIIRKLEPQSTPVQGSAGLCSPVS